MFDRFQASSPPIAVLGHSERFSAGENYAGRLTNLRVTEQGTLRTVSGPAAYHPSEWEDNWPSSPSPHSPDVTYSGPFDGLYHASLGEHGARDVLLVVGTINTGSGAKYGVWTHKGWNWSNGGWSLLAGDYASADYRTSLTEGTRPQFLTQFVGTPGGIIIIPQGSRALFYDGEYIAPLGFSDVPAPPTPVGPHNEVLNDGGAVADVANAGGFAVSGRSLPRVFGNCRLGSIDASAVDVADTLKKSNPLGGVLAQGEWRGATQLIDHWGNLSAHSGLSVPIRVAKDENLTKSRASDPAELADRLRVEFAWSGIVPGPPHTAGRLLLRTCDQLNTTRPGLFEVPSNASASEDAFATLPDNVSTWFTDNVPDSWLVVPAVDVVPVPEFKLAAFFAGSLWVANTRESPGKVMRSLPGRFGTFRRGDELFFDATGREVTGLHAVAQGLLVFTATSVFLVRVNDAGDGVTASTVHPSVGCVAPNSIATLHNGLTVWLSREGFHAYDGAKVTEISTDIQKTVSRINRSWRLRSCAAVDVRSGEYRCWVPVDNSSNNNLCVVFDGQFFRERTDVAADAVCVTRDERELMLAAGSAGRIRGDAEESSSGVWVLDHEDRGVTDPKQHTAVYETHWLRSSRSHRRASPSRIILWLVESRKGSVDVKVMRDWRESLAVHEVTAEMAPTLYPNDDIPRFFDVDELGGSYLPPGNPRSGKTAMVFMDRRPYWTKVDVSVPSCEVFRIRVSVDGDAEFLGFVYEEADKHDGGIKLPTGVR